MPFQPGKSGNPNGRPVGGVGKARAKMVEIINARLPLEKRIHFIASLAEGIYEERTIVVAGKKTKVEVFKRAPDFEALKYLTDQAEGKAPQSLQVTGEDGAPLQVAGFNVTIVNPKSKGKK